MCIFTSAERNLFACLPDRPTNSSCKDNYPVYISCNGKVYIKITNEMKLNTPSPVCPKYNKYNKNSATTTLTRTVTTTTTTTSTTTTTLIRT